METESTCRDGGNQHLGATAGAAAAVAAGVGTAQDTSPRLSTSGAHPAAAAGEPPAAASRGAVLRALAGEGTWEHSNRRGGARRWEAGGDLLSAWALQESWAFLGRR